MVAALLGGALAPVLVVAEPASAATCILINDALFASRSGNGTITVSGQFEMACNSPASEQVTLLTSTAPLSFPPEPTVQICEVPVCNQFIGPFVGKGLDTLTTVCFVLVGAGGDPILTGSPPAAVVEKCV
jgi:hypothetical protein